jgi:hypothetical protein
MFLGNTVFPAAVRDFSRISCSTTYSHVRRDSAAAESIEGVMRAMMTVRGLRVS